MGLTSREMAATRRSNNFDFLRLFAAASVVITHSIANLDGTSFLWLDGDQQAFFYDGVPMFFILSGYLVYRSAQQNYDAGRPKRAYLRNRALRVLPAIAVYFAIVVIVELLFYGVPAVSALKWPSSLWRGIHFPNGSLWTIPVEISFYLAVPVFLWFERRAGTVRLLQGLLVLACIGAILPLADENGLSNSITYHMRYSFTSWMTFFLLGIAWLRYEHRIRLNATGAAAALVVYLALRSFDVLGVHERLGLVASELVGAIPLAYLVFYIGYKGPPFLAGFTRRIGDLSYATYIWHVFVIDVLVQTGAAAAWPKAVQPAAVLAITLAIALVSWWTIEGPSLRLKRWTSRTVPLPQDVTAAESSQPAPAAG